MDATEPLLGKVVECDGDVARTLVNGDAADIVDFDPAGDDENPVEWRPAFKWGIVGLLALMAFTV